ncbi:septation protein SepH [Georgenia alba]|uniref:Septation protein SepH n=1 Tax=Georgenia alba TaxID=2233858 RepID=A0ABW2Q9F5_9MICO
MVELELLGLQGDGGHLTLTDEEGRRYRLAIDDALRAAVRRDRPRLEVDAASGMSLRPKDIQAHLRAGATVEEVAERSGLPVEHVNRYLGPVVAERDWVVQQAQNQRVGRDTDAPRLGDLVLDRLAARGVEVSTLEWTAVRRSGKPWEVVATFVAAEKEREARWSVDLTTRSLHAVDDEARWLSETELSTPPQPRRHLNPVAPGRAASARSARSARSAVTPATAPATPPAEDPHDVPAASAGAAEPTGQAGDGETETLLAELAANRGTRLELQPELEPHDEDGANLWGPGAHPPASRPEQARDAHVLALPRRERSGEERRGDDAPAPVESGGSATAESATKSQNGRRSRRNQRRSVPSWDEIVFGARPE